MKVFMLVDDDVLAFEPLASEVHISDLYIGSNSIFKETLENLWQSGITGLTIVVEKWKVAHFEKYQRRFNFGRRDGHVDVDIVALSVDRITPGNVLRELFTLMDQLDNFMLLFWNTLLTVPLYALLEEHERKRKELPRYAMTALFIEDSNRKFCCPDDDCIIIFDENNELLSYERGGHNICLNEECMARLKSDSAVTVRYDLCSSGVYICNKSVVEHFTNWFEHNDIEDYILDCLGREFKTEEVHIAILQSDIMFPTYPAALRIKTPRDYHSIYMEYISRFQNNNPLSQKPVSNYESRCGPMVREDAMFVNNSAFAPPHLKTKYLFTAVSNSIVGQRVTLGKGTTVDRCVIFDDVTIGKNCTLRDSIIMNQVEIASDTVIPPGSIICSATNLTPKVLESLKGTLRASKSVSKYIDLTIEDKLGTEVVNGVHLWPISAFGAVENTCIGLYFYDFIKPRVPEPPAVGYRGAKQDEEDDESDSSEDQSVAGDSDGEIDIIGNSEPAGGNNYSEVGYEIVEELTALTIECLEYPDQLVNKVLEIKSLKISHNLQKATMVKIAFQHGLSWIVERTKDGEQLQHTMEKCRFREFLSAFEYQIVERDYYSDILRVCNDLGKDVDFFSQVCEALYHSDIMEFEELQPWLSESNISGERIDSFAKWLAED